MPQQSLLVEHAAPRFEWTLDYLTSIAVVVFATAVSVPLRSRLEFANFAMVYLMGVIFVAVRCRRGAAIMNAFLSVTAFYYFLLPVHNSFVLEDQGYLIPLTAMLIVALVISTLTDRIRRHAAKAAHAEIEIESERMRNSLLSAVSHDIKTPLASIYGAATSLLEEEDRLDQSARRDLVESIAEEAERLNRLVTNLLEMTRLEGGVPVRREWHPLEEIIGAALTRLEKALRGRPVSIRIPSELPLVRVDDVLIEEVFTNIIENAVKYTPVGTALEIVAALENHMVVVSIRDSGSGFRPGEEAHVFEKFFRGNNNGVRGAGLGLAICRAIIHGHKGAISAENRPGGGAVVRIELPVGGVPPEVGIMPENVPNER